MPNLVRRRDVYRVAPALRIIVFYYVGLSLLRSFVISELCVKNLSDLGVLCAPTFLGTISKYRLFSVQMYSSGRQQ